MGVLQLAEVRAGVPQEAEGQEDAEQALGKGQMVARLLVIHDQGLLPTLRLLNKAAT